MIEESPTDLLGRLTLEEKVSLLAGADLWHTASVERLGVRPLKVTDGPNGARGADGNHGPTSTSFPVGAAMGATWDPDLIREVGVALAHEATAKGARVLLGPTVNIPRVPNAGRNFECFSEDSLLSGNLAAAWIAGLQSGGIAACIKHFVCNDQEHERFSVDAIVDERTLREIYLEPFRIAIEEAQPWALMTSYNSINGTTASEHSMLQSVLRDEFAFDGLIMSDWYGTYGPGVMVSGLDLEMPGPGRWLDASTVRNALEAGEVSLADVDRKVEHLLELIARTGAAGSGTRERADERPEHRELARRVAAESMVLLTNSGMLPLSSPARIAVIGELAALTPHQGGGSSSVNAHRVVSILDGIREAVHPDVEVTWMPGCAVSRRPPPLDPACLVDGVMLVEYFDRGEPTGEPVRAVESPRSFLSFFGTGDEWVDYEEFSVRMTGRFVADVGGRHTFSFEATGRLRVQVNGDVVVDEWSAAPDGGTTVPLDLAEGEEVALEVEYASAPGARLRYLAAGCAMPGPEVSIESAATTAADADAAIVVAGLTAEWESEGFDRPDLRLPGLQDGLIAAVAARQPNTAVVVVAGSVVEMPWVEDVEAVVHAWYGGQEVGHAVADVILGRVDPGGRLPVTFPVDSRQHPGLLNYPGSAGTVRYGEGVYVGYRGFDRLGLEPMFPFGHGLSYTEFSFRVDGMFGTPERVAININVTNTGGRSGTEVIQVYARGIGDVDRKLVGFRKVWLAKGETTATTIQIPVSRLRWWDPETSAWQSCDGVVDLEVSASCGKHVAKVTLDGQ